MVEVLVWLLIVTPTTAQAGGPRTLERFASAEKCELVREKVAGMERYLVYKAACIPAQILVTK